MATSFNILLTVVCTLTACCTQCTCESPAVSSHSCKNQGSILKTIAGSTFPGQPYLLEISPSYMLLPFQPTPVSATENISVAMQYAFGQNPKMSVFGCQAKNTTVCLKTECHGKEEGFFEVNIFLWYCPPGFRLIDGLCICNQQDLSEYIKCNQSHYISYVFVGFCVSRENGASHLLIARCAFADHVIAPLLQITQNNISGEVHFCNNFHRRGKLCGKCVDKYGISIYSDSFDCIKCSGNRIWNILEYLAVEFIPTTIFFMIIFFFHVGITNGPVNGFIFFAQVVTVPYEVLYLTYALKLYVSENSYFSTILTDLIIDPYCIWNLDFFRIFHSKICLSTKMKVIHALSLQYISALYPLLLLLIAYIFIELQARNYRLVVFLWRLLCFPCMRWRRSWKAKNSIVDAFASCILLSYSKVILASFAYFSHSTVQDEFGRHITEVLSYDTSVVFYSSEHAPFIAIAIIFVVTFGALPPLVLTFYQFQTFQRCLHCCRLQKTGLQQFVEVFQGCYKDGTNGSIDCRFFAGLYFIFRIIILLILALNTSFPSGFLMVIIATTSFMLLFAVFQPYKSKVYNIIDILLHFLLATITTIQAYVYSQLQQTLHVNNVFLLYYILLYIPLGYIIVITVHWLYKRWKRRKNQIQTPVPRSRCVFRESLMDRDEEDSYTETYNVNSSSHVTYTEVDVSLSSNKEESREFEEVKKKPLIEKAGLKQQELLEPLFQYGTM